MTVSSTNTKNSYNGDASTTVFAYTFKVFDDDDISVILRTDATGGETVQTKGTHYSVSGVGSAGGGNITFVTPPASGITVVLIRATVQTQTTDYTPNDPFPAASHEEALDRLTLMVQDQQEELDRSIKVSRTNTISSSEFTIGADDRANKVFAFDENGDFSVTQEIGTYKGTDATVTASAYSARDIVKSTTTAQLDNVYIATQNSPAGTSLTNTTYWQLLIDAVAAATSAAAAASSATDAETAQTAAEAAQAAAETAQANAETAETNAETAETNAETAQAAAEVAQAAAETAETNAETAETNAASSATASASSASASAASASAASTSESNASTSETNAAASASSASTSASTATTQAGIATTKAGEAATSATNSATSAANSATSETNAASSATAAAASQVSAANSAASAAAAFDNFDDTYLGSFASDPTVDNDGDALVQGALYFNSTDNEMRVYDGANWIAASSAGGVSLILYEYTATAAQTTFSGSDDNAATLSYTANNIQVVMNGVILDPSDYTATNGTSVVLASGAALNDVVNIYAFQSFTVADTVSASAGGTFNANVTWADNAKAIFGAGNDLQIYHDGLGSYIKENGTGGLNILGQGQINLLNSAGDETLAQFIANSGVTLYHNNDEKLETTSGGIDVTGTVTADGLDLGDTTDAATVSTTASDYQLQLGSAQSTTGDIGRNISFDYAGTTVAAINSVDGGSSNSADLSFYTGNATSISERMRIDSSGNLLVGTTTILVAEGNGEGISLASGSYGGLLSVSRDGGRAATFNRKTSDGDIVEFRKDGTTVGSIGSSSTSSKIFIGGGNVGITFTGSGRAHPTNNSGVGLDNAMDWGQSNYRFDDIYATNGTIQTSDQNEKQQIASLTDAEITAAKAISALFKTYKWNDSVAEKGDAARTHTGVIAQDVQSALTDAGLDAGDYAFFISSTWWEAQTDVPAVEAVAEVLDEDGNVVTEAVEAKEAYTRTDTYDTAEEAPEGATERTRLGVRYPELLAFVGAATEQRLANIETRLAALENV